MVKFTTSTKCIKNKNAFTIVEVIVTVMILTVLATVAFYCYNGYLVSARDSKRIIELDNIVTSLETHQLRDGILPDPDEFVDITYSGAVVWRQGIFGKGMSDILGYSEEEVLDPNEISNYTYSVKENGKEYSIAGALETDNATETVNILSSSSGGLEMGNAVVRGNYNGVITNVILGGVDYILAVPSIVSSNLSSTNLVDVIENNNLVFDGYQNLPASYSGSKLIVDNNLDFSPDNLIIYTGSIEYFSDEEERMSLLYVLQKSYSGSLANDESFLGSVRNDKIDIVFPDQKTYDLSCDLVNKKLNYKIDCNYVNFSSFYVIDESEILGAIDFTVLAGHQVNYIFQTGDTLWFGTLDGIFSYDNTTGEWTTYEEVEGFKITVINQDMEGNMWFGTSDSGILVYDGEEFSNFQSDYDPVHINSNHFTPSSTNGIPSNAIYDIVMELSGNMIIGTHNGGSYYDQDTETFNDFYVVSGKKHYLYSENRIRDFYIDHNEYLWLGTDRGAYLFTGDLEITPDGDFYTYNGWNGLPSIGNKSKLKVNVIYEDSFESGYNMWFGTNEGIGKLDSDLNPDKIYYQYGSAGLASNDIKSIFEDTYTDNMWFGTNEGVSVLSGSTFTNYTKDVDGSNLGPVYYIYQDENGLNILGTQNGSTTIE